MKTIAFYHVNEPEEDHWLICKIRKLSFSRVPVKGDTIKIVDGSGPLPPLHRLFVVTRVQLEDLIISNENLKELDRFSIYDEVSVFVKVGLKQ